VQRYCFLEEGIEQEKKGEMQDSVTASILQCSANYLMIKVTMKSNWTIFIVLWNIAVFIIGI